MHESYYKRPLLWLLIIYIVCLSLFYQPHPKQKDVFHFTAQKEVTLIGKVVGFPAVKKKSNNVILKVSRVNNEPASGYIYARFKDYMPLWHETLQVSGTLKQPYSISLLGNFDWASYLATKNVFTEIKVNEQTQVKAPNWLSRFIVKVRADILQTFEQNFDRNLAAIAGGVLLGERGEIDEQLYTDFQDSGAIHLLVASGGNVGFVTLVVFAFCALFGLGRRRTVWVALLIAGVYTLIAGADAPLTRAYFMTVCAVIGYLLHRNSGVFQGLILSCFIILLLNPSALFETGFQMSFLATLAIVICLHNYELPYKWPRWVKFFVQIFLATLSTQLVLLPVFTNVFFKVSFIGLLANMILVPLASFLMAVSFLFYIFSLLRVAVILKPLAWASLLVFEKLVESFASLPFASMPAAAWRGGWIAAYYMGLFLLFNYPLKNLVKRIYKPFLLLILLLPLAQYIFFNPPTVWLLNEWNKNAILLRTRNGKRILIGEEIDGAKLARAVLRSGGRSVQAVLINSNDPKQVGQVSLLEKQIKVEKLIRPFEDIWPGEEINIAGLQVEAEWGKMLNKNKQLWINRGYSGRDDNLSYRITGKNFNFTTGGNNRFILRNDEIAENMHNATQTVKL